MWCDKLTLNDSLLSQHTLIDQSVKNQRIYIYEYIHLIYCFFSFCSPLLWARLFYVTVKLRESNLSSVMSKMSKNIKRKKKEKRKPYRILSSITAIIIRLCVTNNVSLPIQLIFPTLYATHNTSRYQPYLRR